MDPNSNLAEQEQLLTQGETRRGRSASLARRDRLTALRSALYSWLAGGGFPPDWTRYPRAADWYVRHTPFGPRQLAG